jgi:hypothetical protein
MALAQHTPKRVRGIESAADARIYPEAAAEARVIGDSATLAGENFLTTDIAHPTMRNSSWTLARIAFIASFRRPRRMWRAILGAAKVSRRTTV